jgi:hypothetical protein
MASDLDRSHVEALSLLANRQDGAELVIDILVKEIIGVDLIDERRRREDIPRHAVNLLVGGENVGAFETCAREDRVIGLAHTVEFIF